ncbi:MAG: discoidin domain-containing protein [Opitutaceae bacterium]|jgi:hypothetical protein|nr:discoidin domain-containing protein [Opitutaceae bacterium]
MKSRIPALITTAAAFLLAGAFASAARPADLPASLGPNLALKKSFECSEPNQHKWGTGATDGSWEGKRGKTFSTGNAQKFPKTLTIDLQTSQEISHVLVGTPSFGSTKGITVSISANGQDYTNIGSNDFALGREDSHLFKFKPAKARYVRLTFTGNHAEKAGKYATGNCFVTEVEVYGR